MEPIRLKTPVSDLVLERVTDFYDRGLARYRLWRIPNAGTAAPTIATFPAPGDVHAERLVDAWCAGRKLFGNSITLQWQRTVAEIEEDLKASYLAALESGDREGARVLLQDYREAAADARLLQEAFFGKWPSLAGTNIR